MNLNKTSGSVRERLLQAAYELFYAEGVHTVGIDRILQHSGVAKASLYSTFKSKDELVRAYLDGRAEWLARRVENRVATVSTPRERILAVFDEFVDRVAEGKYNGCPFIRACAEDPSASNLAHQAADSQRSWLRKLFVRLGSELGVANPEVLGRQLALIYDGATVAVSMDKDPGAGVAARSIAEKILS